jgi:hypothetical protein
LEIFEISEGEEKYQNIFELEKILDIIRNEDEEFIFFVSLAASKILDNNKKTERYYSLIFLNEILNENLKEKEFLKIWPNLFNIFINKMEFKHIFDKEENLFEILFFNYFFNLIIRRFFHLIEPQDYQNLLIIYNEIDNFDILFNFIENNDVIFITSDNLQKNDKGILSFSYKNENFNFMEFKQFLILEEKNLREKEKDKDKGKININLKKNEIFNYNYNFNFDPSKFIRKDTSLEIIILIIFKLIKYNSQNFFNLQLSQNNDFNYLDKIKDCFKFLYRIIYHIKNFEDISIDTLTNIHNIFKLLQEKNLICIILSTNIENSNYFYLLIENLIPKLLISLPNVDDQKWHFYLSVLNTLTNSLLIKENNLQRLTFLHLKNLFRDVKIPKMILKEVFNILASYYNQIRIEVFKHEKYWEDLFFIFFNLIKSNEDIVYTENEIATFWQIYVKGFLDCFRTTSKSENIDDDNILEARILIKETLNFVYNKGIFFILIISD